MFETALLFPDLRRSWTAVFGISSVYEQPRYEEIERLSGDIAIRHYGPRVAAESTVKAADDRAASNTAFKLLFRYITGSNRSNSEISVSAPVERTASPVMIANDGGGNDLHNSWPGNNAVLFAPVGRG